MPVKVPVAAFLAGMIFMFGYMYWQRQFSLTLDAAGVALGVMLVVGVLVRLFAGAKKGK